MSLRDPAIAPWRMLVGGLGFGLAVSLAYPLAIELGFVFYVDDAYFWGLFVGMVSMIVMQKAMCVKALADRDEARKELELLRKGFGK